jgi:hypothetical protein
VPPFSVCGTGLDGITAISSVIFAGAPCLCADRNDVAFDADSGSFKRRDLRELVLGPVTAPTGRMARIGQPGDRLERHRVVSGGNVGPVFQAVGGSITPVAPAQCTIMCDDTFQGLWEALVFVFLLAAPPLLLVGLCPPV